MLSMYDHKHHEAQLCPALHSQHREAGTGTSELEYYACVPCVPCCTPGCEMEVERISIDNDQAQNLKKNK